MTRLPIPTALGWRTVARCIRRFFLLLTGCLALLSSLPLSAQPAAKQKAPGVDLQGDPLPPGALARLGTVRLRAGAPVSRLAFSLDGKWLATAHHDGKVILWDSATGREVHVMVHPADDIWALAFSHDGQSLATASTQERRQFIRLWDVSHGREIEHFRKVDNAALAGLAFSPDGRLLAGVSAGDKITLWKVAGWKEVHTVRSPGRYFTDLAFSHDGRLLAAISPREEDPNEIVYVWEVTTGRQLRQIEVKPPGVGALAFVPRSRIVAILRGDGTVYYWNVDTGAERRKARVAEKRLWRGPCLPTPAR
jgi:WD40 repeat protein